MAKRTLPAQYELTSVWFNDVEKSHYETWITDRTLDVLNLLTEFQNNGLKVSVSEDRNGSVSLVSVTFKPLGTRKKGHVFLYRHSDLEKCLCIAFFHVSQIMDFGSALQVTETETDW